MIGPMICFQMMKYIRKYFSIYTGHRECEPIYNNIMGKQFRLKWIRQKNHLQHQKCHICQGVASMEFLFLIYFIKIICETFSNSQNQFDIYLNANFWKLIVLDNKAGLLVAMVIIQLGCFLHQLYFSNKTANIVNAVLFEEDYEQFHPPYRYRSKMACTVVFNSTRMIIESFVMFVIPLGEDLFYRF